MNDISLKQLEVFAAVVEYGGFTRAAEELFFNQSTVSAHISQLEHALGRELFVRGSRRKLRLTEAGEQVYPIAKRILADCGALHALFTANAPDTGAVALGASTVPGQYLLPEYLADYLQREKNFRYTLRRGDSASVHRMLLNGEIALGFVGAVSEPEAVDYFPLAEDKLVLTAPNNAHYRALKERGVYGRELLACPTVAREEGSGTDRSVQNYMRSIGIMPDALNIVARVDDPEAIKHMVAGGVGVSVLSALAVRSEVESGTLLAFEMDRSALKRSIYLITQRGRSLSPAEQRFFDFLKSCARRKKRRYPES